MLIYICLVSCGVSMTSTLHHSIIHQLTHPSTNLSSKIYSYKHLTPNSDTGAPAAGAPPKTLPYSWEMCLLAWISRGSD